MKTITFLFCTLFCLSSTFAMNYEDCSYSNNPTIEVCEDANDENCEDICEEAIARSRVYINWGRRRRNCRGWGICSITIIISWKSMPKSELSGSAMATISRTPNGKINLSIDKNSMDAKTYATYFQNGQLRMDEAFELPKDVLKQLGMKSYTIKAGKYGVYKPSTAFGKSSGSNNGNLSVSL